MILTWTTGKVSIIGNTFEDGRYAIFAVKSPNGVATGNRFESYGVGLNITTADSNGWKITNNNFNGISNQGIALTTAAGATVVGNTGTCPLLLNTSGSAAASIFKGNVFSNVTLQSSFSSGNTFEANHITGTISHTSATFNSNTWRRNTGAGCAGIFYGTTTLVSGTSGIINTAAANSARKWAFSRQAPNASTALGSLALGTVTAQMSFVINSLNDTATVATGDLSTVYWEILE
jgi:hypothetical protein